MSEPAVQPAGFLLELSHDWLIHRASENAHGFLSEYHQRLIGEPFSEFTLAQPLHDLRNSLARQRASSGIARAYRVHLFDEPRLFDIAFQSQEETILLEGLPSSEEGFGDCLGSVSRLIEGLGKGERRAMMEDAARRMRALTGFDRTVLVIGGDKVESNRTKLPELVGTGTLPAMVANSRGKAVRLFPEKNEEPIDDALLRSPTAQQLEELKAAGIGSTLRAPVVQDGQEIGYFQCENRTARAPSFELHAAAELFAQIFGMLLRA